MTLIQEKVKQSIFYTIEPGLAVATHGYIGLEEDVLVTASGAKSRFATRNTTLVDRPGGMVTPSSAS